MKKRIQEKEKEIKEKSTKTMEDYFKINSGSKIDGIGKKIQELEKQLKKQLTVPGLSPR